MRSALLLQALGALLMSYGLWLLAPWLGLAVLGLLTLVGGITMEMEARGGAG